MQNTEWYNRIVDHPVVVRGCGLLLLCAGQMGVA